MGILRNQALRLAFRINERNPAVRVDVFLSYFGIVTKLILFLWLLTIIYQYQELMLFLSEDNREAMFALKQISSDATCSASYYKIPLRRAWTEAMKGTPINYNSLIKGGVSYVLENFYWMIVVIFRTAVNYLWFSVEQLLDGGKLAYEFAKTEGATTCFDLHKVKEHSGKSHFGDVEYWQCSSDCADDHKLSQYDSFLIYLGIQEARPLYEQDKIRDCIDGPGGCKARFFSKFVSPPGLFTRMTLFVMSVSYIVNILQLVFVLIPCALSATYASYVVEILASLPMVFQILAYVSLLSPVL